MIKILDVCSGIGGFSLGLEATGGFDTVAFCEYDEFCRKVLNKHWPDVPIYKDLKEIGNEPTRLIQEFDLICGGVPCQPFSVAGRKKGKEDDRHLWPFMFKIIEQKKPTWVIVENVGGFVNVALDDVCLDLETEGYATQSFIIPACGVEAPHRRDRIWIIGKYTSEFRQSLVNSDSLRSHEHQETEEESSGRGSKTSVATTSVDVDDSECNEHIEEIRRGDGEEREDEKRQGEEDSASRISSGASGLRVSDQGHETSGHVADSNSGHDNGEKEEVRTRGQASDDGSTGGGTEDVADSESSDRDDDEVIKEHGETKTQEVFGNRSSVSRTQERYTQHREGNAESRLGGMVDGLSSRLDGHHGFEVEPDIPRVAENIPDRVNRLKALGNSIVPQIIYHIGMAILEEERK
jgi:DNA (cytosine-5)-methyltransferase 1